MLSAAQNLQELIIFDPTLKEMNHPRLSPEFVAQVFQSENRDKIMELLYSQSTEIYIWEKPEWFQQPGYSERLAEII